jgi:hypothetical protein
VSRGFEDDDGISRSVCSWNVLSLICTVTSGLEVADHSGASGAPPLEPTIRYLSP